MDPLERLVLLVRDEKFTGTALPDFMVYLRWWTGGVLDAVTVNQHQRAFAVRAYDIDLHRPEDMSCARPDWRQRGPVVPVVNELLMLAAAPGVCLTIRLADARAVALKVAHLCVPELVAQ